MFRRMGRIWLTHVEIHFVYSLAWEWFDQHMLCLLSMLTLVKMQFCVLTWMGGVWSTYVVVHFDSLLAWESFDQHKSRFLAGWEGFG